LNFFFRNKNHSLTLVDFLVSSVPTKMKESKELISRDIHEGTYDNKFSFIVEMPKICKDDLII